MKRPVMRSVVWILALCALGVLVAGGADTAEADGGRHPYFDDGGTLRWYRSYARALAVAKREGKLVFIESGRRRCTMCRRLCSNVLAHRRVCGRISRIAVGVAAECDRPERAVQRLFRRHLQNPRMLPLVAFVTPDGRWVTGFWGSRSVTQFSRDVGRAEAAWRRLQAARQPDAPKPAPEPAPEPEATPPAPEATPPAPAPDACCPDAGDPDAGDPDAGDPDAGDPDAGDPDAGDPDAGDPDAGDPDAGDPDAGDPGAGDPGAGDPDACCPGGVCTPPDMACGPEHFAPDAFGGPGDERVAEAPPAPETPEPRAPAPETGRERGFPPPTGPRGLPAPRRDAPILAVGSPDATVVVPPAPSPSRRPAVAERSPKETTPIHRASTTQSGRVRRAERAAARGQWAEVLRLTADARTDATLAGLRRKAHAWAHDTLDAAVTAITAGDVDGARGRITSVRRQMDGQPEAVDARRGLDAIEFVKDLHYLPDESLVRRAVRKNAYEKMRGSRWAGLFR